MDDVCNLIGGCVHIVVVGCGSGICSEVILLIIFFVDLVVELIILILDMWLVDFIIVFWCLVEWKGGFIMWCVVVC